MEVEYPLDVNFHYKSRTQIRLLDRSSTYADHINDLENTCRHIAQNCVTASNSVAYSPTLRCIPMYLSDTDFVQMEWMDELKHSINIQLENVLRSSIKVSSNTKRQKHIWDSFVLRDAEKSIRSLREHYLRSIAKPMDVAQTVRLGRVYAWAREQSGRNEDNPTTEQLSGKRLLQRRLARLVRLTRTGKQFARSHPLIISLRHQLARIRSRVSVKMCAERTAATRLSTLWHSDYSRHPNLVENAAENLKHLVHSDLYNAFSKLIDKLTVSFVELSSQAPGLPTSKCHSEVTIPYWRNVAAKTVLDFYLQSDDHHMPSVADLDDLDAMSVDLVDSSDSEAESSNAEDAIQLDPALIQATLDQFDHIKNRTSRKRRRSITHDEDVSDLVDSHTSPKKGPVDISSTERVSGDVNVQSAHLLNVSSDDATELNAEPNHSVDMDIGCPADDPDVPPEAESSTTEVVSSGPMESTETQNITKKKTRRSFRRRTSRTPSDHSCSEGEVMTDTEERSINTEDPFVELNEKFSADIEEEEAEALIRMVNEQFADTTPTDDIDLTELEIMDEWALPPSVLTARDVTDLKKSQLNTKPVAPLSDETETKIREVINEALLSCSTKLENMITDQLDANGKFTEDFEDTKVGQVSRVANGIEETIGRTVSAFKEHVTSVLTNLLHAASTKLEDGQTKRTPVVPVTAPRRTVGGRKGSRLLGMLRSYQQDVVRRSATTTNPVT